MDVNDARRSAIADWPLAELSRMYVNLWGAFLASPQPRPERGPRLSHAEHIREFGEPYGSNGA